MNEKKSLKKVGVYLTRKLGPLVQSISYPKH